MTEPVKLYTDRSEAETDDTCGMKLWWNRLEGGTGIVPKAEPLALEVGRTVHEDFATIASWTDLSPEAVQTAIDAILTTVPDGARVDVPFMERLYRRLGWIAAWTLYLEPRIRQDYEPVTVEHELFLDRSPLWVATTPDRVLRNRKYGFLKYMEYKSTISASKKWLDSWRYMIQLHIGIAAVQEELKEPVKFAQVVGLMKGNPSLATGHLMHPYVWAWYNEKENRWTSKYDEARSANWTAMPVWEYPGGVVEWVQLCGKEVAEMQFPTAPPTVLDTRMLDSWVARRLHRAKVVAQVKEACQTDLVQRAIYFEERTKNCKPAWGDACPYLPLCWSAEQARNPLKSGDFVVRVPHHDLETVGML